MFFKRTKDKPAVVQVSATAEPEKKEARPLAAADLRQVVDAKALGFKTTADLQAATGLIGQERALRAIEFGTNIKALDFNIFVLGPPASGKTTAVKSHLAKKAAQTPAPGDWVYVNNFEDPSRPRAIALPSGQARRFAKAMNAVVDELRAAVPAAFEGEDYQARRRAIEEEFRAGQEGALDHLNRKAI